MTFPDRRTTNALLTILLFAVVLAIIYIAGNHLPVAMDSDGNPTVADIRQRFVRYSSKIRPNPSLERQSSESFAVNVLSSSALASLAA
jgi:hypothetical protein